MANLIIEITEYHGRVVTNGIVQHSSTPETQSIEHVNIEELARYKELHKHLREKTIEWYQLNHPEVIPEQPL